jgi:hypothetical protein
MEQREGGGKGGSELVGKCAVLEESHCSAGVQNRVPKEMCGTEKDESNEGNVMIYARHLVLGSS